MKKYLSILMIAVLLMMGTACSSGSGASSTAESKAESSEAAPSEAASSKTSVSGSVTASGSSALYPLAKDAADKFKKLNPDVSITLNAGGSGTGLKQVADDTVDIGNSDVDAASKLTEDKAKGLVDHKVCVVTMAPIVSADVKEKVESLTTEQLIDIFTGKTTNWKEVGGPDEAISLVTRPSTSGTRALFKEFALNGKEEASNKSLETDDSGTLLQTVAQHKGAIGYVALSYLTKEVEGVKTMAIDGVEPTLENTYSGKYKVWGYEHMYTKGEAQGAVKAFIDYMMSEDYGKIMESLGYNAASKMQVER
ncbi:MAG: phosphate ABC transporter substrate-binding protein [Oscillospiraceae bacterium]|jgi:phosphate transport system substrate-binding protein|nr:phosphate ABC transporter substrate-binding protein [Oscillospiraceae bacterium]